MDVTPLIAAANHPTLADHHGPDLADMLTETGEVTEHQAVNIVLAARKGSRAIDHAHMVPPDDHPHVTVTWIPTDSDTSVLFTTVPTDGPWVATLITDVDSGQPGVYTTDEHGQGGNTPLDDAIVTLRVRTIERLVRETVTPTR